MGGVSRADECAEAGGGAVQPSRCFARPVFPGARQHRLRISSCPSCDALPGVDGKPHAGLAKLRPGALSHADTGPARRPAAGLPAWLREDWRQQKACACTKHREQREQPAPEVAETQHSCGFPADWLHLPAAGTEREQREHERERERGGEESTPSLLPCHSWPGHRAESSLRAAGGRPKARRFTR